MKTSTNHPKTRLRVAGASALSCSVLLGMSAVSGVPAAFAAEAEVGLGTSGSYSVLGGQSVTNTGNSILAQDLGVNPGTSITGFPPGLVLGTTHAADAQAVLAQSDLVKAYDDAASRTPTARVMGDLAGMTLVSGVYVANETLELNGTLTLDGQGDPNAVWIFQVGSALTTASASSIELVNGAQACNVYWQVGSSATLGTASDFKGSVLALTSVTVTNEATVEGRVLARNGSVTLDDNTFTSPECTTGSPTEPTSPAVPPVTPEPSQSPESTPEPTPAPEATKPSVDEAPPAGATPGSPETPPAAPDAEPTPSGETTPAGPAVPEDKGPGSGEAVTELARTGAESNWIVAGAGIALAVLGAALLAASRKPRGQ